MNILHLHLSKSWGGGGVMMINLCKQLNQTEKEFNFQFLCASGGVLESICQENNYNYKTTSVKPKIGPIPVFDLIKLLKNEDIDLIHIHGSTALSIFALTNLFYKTPPGIFHKKTNFKIKNKWFTKFKYNHPNLKKIICVSKAAQEISRPAIKDQERLITIYDGTDIDTLEVKSKINLRNQYKIDDSKILVGNIANHIKAKDLETLLKTMDYLVNVKEDKRFHLIQIGKFTQLTPQYKNMIEELDLSNHVTFTDSLPQASSLISQFDCFLFSSKNEGLPQVILETMYRKAPIVSTNAGGISEVIQDGVNGFILPIGDYKGLAESLIKLMENEELIDSFTEISHAKIDPDFTTKTMAKNIYSLYDNIIKNR